MRGKNAACPAAMFYFVGNTVLNESTKQWSFYEIENALLRICVPHQGKWLLTQPRFGASVSCSMYFSISAFDALFFKYDFAADDGHGTV